ncbi:MAG: ABC transporter ATP-binding protein [Akkermansiaceae bacterium]|nr:ABC transporter ATP-binding protein [Akkermansiaceae bacterium]MCP5542501.1 ABC transporter ATP-binding protein [Akkermansiaceae bacterium]MCP5545964.1 ABC transporter ATP-binding protein [Akkermansiaceae bacterium]
MIELRNVTKFYPMKSGVRDILRDVSMVIPTGANLAVLGPNGAGKSTFLRLIGGAEAPNSGRILSDQSISWPLGINSGFQGSLTGRQNLLFACRVNGLNQEQIETVTDEVVDFAKLGEYFDLPLKTYSSGMRARLSFGLSMAFTFDVYLIDELTSVGDAIFRSKAKQAFKNMRQRASIIFVSHNLSTLRESCDSALFLHDGTAAFFPSIDDGIEAYQEYIRSDRDKHAKELKEIKRARRAKRRARRRARNKAAKEAGNDDSTTDP